MVALSRKDRRRGASLYITVLGVSMIVAMISLATSSISRLELRAASSAHSTQQAVVAARGGLEYALHWMNNNSRWRSELKSGVDVEAITFADASAVWRVTDNDGDLDDDHRDHAVLRCVGSYQNSYAVMEVDIEPTGRSLTSLDSAICSGRSAFLDNDCSVSGLGVVSSNEAIFADNAKIELAAEAVKVCSGGEYSAGKTEGVMPRELPGDHVFDWYIKVGTQIDLERLPKSFGVYQVSLDLLSRQVSTLGAVNPHGIYWIDCRGEPLRIRWGRQLGTLVLLNAKAGVAVNDVCLHQADPLNYPVLMVEGNLQIGLTSDSRRQILSELLLVKNLNPRGMPYLDEEDIDALDIYPARLDGIVYATESVFFEDHSNLRGTVIANGEVRIRSEVSIDIRQQSYPSNYAPPGFSAGPGARALPYTWRRTSR